MDDAYKLHQKNFDNLCEDIVNISRVLPNLTPLDLQTELLELKNDPDRVATILRKHFKFYNEERENHMSQDIKLVKRVSPNTPIVQISKDLADIGQKKNRVQLLLKKYFTTPGDASPSSNAMSPSCKRSLDDIDSISNKILKLDDTINTSNNNNNNTNCATPKITSDHLLPPISLNYNQNEENLDSNVGLILSNASESTIENNIVNSEIQHVEETVPFTLEPSSTTEEVNPYLEMTIEDSAAFRLALENDLKKELENNLENEAHSMPKIQTSESNEEQSVAPGANNFDEKNPLYQIIKTFYPDLTLEELEEILSPLDINIYESVDDASTNVVLNEIMNYFETKEKFEQVETNDNNTNILVKTDTQSTETSSTEEYDLKDELSHYFPVSNVDINSTSVLVKQESPYESDLPSYTDENLSLLNKICREIEDDSNNILENKVFVGSKPFSNIATGTDNWVKSALAQPKDTSNTASTSEFNIIKPATKVKTESARKRSVCSTVTSSSINIEPCVNPFGTLVNNEPLSQQMKQENVMNYIDYGIQVTPSTKDALSPPKRSKITENWTAATNPKAVEKPSRRNIERPTRDNLKSSLSNHLGAGHSRTVAYTSAAAAYSKNFVQYLQNRNNISNAYTENLNINGLYLGNELNFENTFVPNPYLANNQPFERVNPNNNNNTKKNLVDDHLDMSRRSSTSLLTKKEEKEVKALLCGLGNGKCNTCKKCLKNNIALKVRNDLFRRQTETPDSFDSDDLLDHIKSESKSPEPTPTALCPVIDITESSSSNSNPLPGTSTELQPNEHHPFYYKIMEMFPDICPDFLRALCSGKDHSSKTLDQLVSTLLDSNYNRREQRPVSPTPALDFDEQYKTLLDLFPDADPTYLQLHCERLFEHPNEFKEFVASLLEHKNYPSKEEYLKKMKLSAQQKQYTTEFDVKKFLEVIPNPEEFFKNREVKRNFVDQDYALTFLKNHYCHLTIKDINIIFRECDHSVVKASVVLDQVQKNMKTRRRLYPLTNCLNIPLLQEIAYVKNKNEILNYMKKQEQEKIENRQYAKNAGLLKTCECCYDDEVMPEEMACCENNHVFCKECVKKGCEVKIGEGKLDFPCLTTCEAKFSLQVLKSVLTPKVFSKMALRKQLEEVKSAGIEELESCPFCEFATIPAPGDKLFRCLNTDCMKESCRSCREPSHIPLRCDEVEKENDVKLRTYIEDKMTEALVRKCYKCSMKFIKEEGCNKMTCSCGAMMCYVCNQPVKDYKHFNGQGGDQYHLCPLYSDTHKLHMDAVKLSAENAKKELGIANNQLKIDPTANLDQHYKRLANRNPQNLPPGMEQLNPQHIHIRIQEFHLARR